MRILIVTISIALLVVSCATSSPINFEDTVKKRASFDFNCPINYINVIQTGMMTFDAKGCTKTGSYKVGCELSHCKAEKLL